MKKILLLIGFFCIILLIACKQEGESVSDQEKAEKFAIQMKPIMVERIHTDDYNNFVKSIDFNEESIQITPLGNIDIDGIINKDNDLGFTFTLNYSDKKNVQSYSYDDILAKKMGNFDKEKMETLPSKESSSKEKYPGTSLRNLKDSSND